jgi:hypothetical protein
MYARENLTKRFVPLLAAIAAAVAMAAGCGDDEAGGDEDGAITTSSLSKAAYIKEANKTCLDGKRSLLKDFESFRSDESEKKRVAAALPELLMPSIEDKIDEIRELGAPQGDEKRIEAILASMQQDFDAAEQQQNVETPIEFLEQFDDSNKLARTYGLNACATGY